MVFRFERKWVRFDRSLCVAKRNDLEEVHGLIAAELSFQICRQSRSTTNAHIQRNSIDDSF